MFATIITLILQGIELWSNRKIIKQGETKLEQENEKIRLQQQDLNAKMIAQFFPAFKDIIAKAIENPETMVIFSEKIQKFASKMKDLYKKEDNK